MSAQEYLSYTYLIGWTKQDLWYYGVRTANKTEPENDLWVHYFTSSDYVKQQRIELGEPNVVQIRQTFIDSNKARLWEEQVLQRMKVVESKQWLNRNDSHAPPIMKGYTHPNYQKSMSDAQRRQISQSLTGKRHSAETKQKMSLSRTGERNHNYQKSMSDAQRRQISQSLTGKRHSAETKQKMSLSRTGERNPKFKGYYITPWGEFSTLRQAKENCPVRIRADSISVYCKHNQIIITKSHIARSEFFTQDDFGQSFENIGFSFKWI